MIVGIATPTLVEGDAVGNDVMGMFYALLHAGHKPRLFANHHTIGDQFCYSLAKFDGQVDALIYHHSINCREGLAALEIGTFHKIVKYHNITPVHFFPEDSRVRYECELGFEQNKKVVNYNVWADSDYNGSELKKIKSDLKYHVVPPFTQAERLVEVEPDYRAVVPINDWNHNILMVGRVAPNKNVILGVEAFALALNKKRNLRLILAGDSGGEYGDKVRTKIQELGLEHKVMMTGKISIQHLKALYLTSAALMVTSLHEGFCVPLVEAMALNLPVVTGSECALKETAGDAAVVVKEYNPSAFAEGLLKVLDDANTYRKLGRARYHDHFHRSAISKSFLSNFNLITRK